MLMTQPLSQARFVDSKRLGKPKTCWTFIVCERTGGIYTSRGTSPSTAISSSGTKLFLGITYRTRFSLNLPRRSTWVWPWTSGSRIKLYQLFAGSWMLKPTRKLNLSKQWPIAVRYGVRRPTLKRQKTRVLQNTLNLLANLNYFSKFKFIIAVMFPYYVCYLC